MIFRRKVSYSLKNLMKKREMNVREATIFFLMLGYFLLYGLTPSNRVVKKIFIGITITLGFIIIFMNYSFIFRYPTHVTFLPLLIIEEYAGNKAISLDWGQIIFLSIILLVYYHFRIEKKRVISQKKEKIPEENEKQQEQDIGGEEVNK